MTGITVRVNGVEATVEADTLLNVLEQYEVNGGSKGVAVALNEQVVPRARWDSTAVKAHDSIEIVHARQGG